MDEHEKAIRGKSEPAAHRSLTGGAVLDVAAQFAQGVGQGVGVVGATVGLKLMADKLHSQNDPPTPKIELPPGVSDK